MRLLLVEDDIRLAEQLKQDLEHAGFAVDVSHDGIDGEFMGNEGIHDAVILDLGLPGKSGLEVLQSWRDADNAVPVLILTARDAWHERVDGFKAGADDYLGKPFHPEELIARINALIRRAHQQTSGTVQAGGLQLDDERQTVTTGDGVCHQLTGTEFRLLRYFMLHPHRILSKSHLIEHVYDNDSDKDSNVIEVYIKRLRAIVGKDLIQTRRGQGYVFSGSA